MRPQYQTPFNNGFKPQTRVLVNRRWLTLSRAKASARLIVAQESKNAGTGQQTLLRRYLES